MRLTPRCLEILNLLSAARWLTTTQLHRRFFSQATLHAARRRIRVLEQNNYTFRYRQNQMAESLITLGIEGKRIIEKHREANITLQRRPPRQLEHLIGINTCRVAAELVPELKYFFAFWELLGLQWKHRLVPDALFALSDRTFALEFDRGQENLRIFLKKIDVYRRGLPGVPINAVLVVVDSQTRLRSLIKNIRPSSHLPCLFSTVGEVQKNGLQSSFLGSLGEQILLSKPVPPKGSVDGMGSDL
jgi:hypothetical protein